MTVESLLCEIRNPYQVQRLLVWQKIKRAENVYFGGNGKGAEHQQQGPISHAIAVTRQKVASALKHSLPHGGKVRRDSENRNREDIERLDGENKQLRCEMDLLKGTVARLTSQVAALSLAPPKAGSVKVEGKDNKSDDDNESNDDDFELFGSSDEENNEEKERIKQERLKAYAEKKSKKAGPIAKSSIILDVKPWDDETDLGKMEEMVRSISQDGLVWGASKLIPLAFGIKKLQIICVVEDDKVSVEDLQENIQEFEDLVQSVDIAAFNKI